MKTKIVSVSQGDYYGKYLNSPAATKVRHVGHLRAGLGRRLVRQQRTFLHRRPVRRPQYGPNTVDYGDYNSPTVNALIDKAESAKDASTAATYWHQADEQIMKDAAFIPFQTQKVPAYHSAGSRTRCGLPSASPTTSPTCGSTRPLTRPDRERHAFTPTRCRGRRVRRSQQLASPGPGCAATGWRSSRPS